jgi:hypothetical protein
MLWSRRFRAGGRRARAVWFTSHDGAPAERLVVTQDRATSRADRATSRVYTRGSSRQALAKTRKQLDLDRDARGAAVAYGILIDKAGVLEREA